MKNNGLLYVVFGEKCDCLASHCIAYSRQYTDLPIQVLTNIKKDKRHRKWDDINNIHFTYFDLPDSENRQIKTTSYEYTKFDKTLYLDADSIIQKHGVEKLFKQI